MVRQHKHEGIYDFDGYMLPHSINRKHYKDEAVLPHQEELNQTKEKGK